MLAVASHDIGQYVKHYERGKKYVLLLGSACARDDCLRWFWTRILTDLGGKTRVMELMSHGNPDVRYQALISVQRLVSHPWAAV